MVEERKKMMRHFYRRCIINEMRLVEKDENRDLILAPVEPVPERYYSTCDSVY
jgi:hypothetical protein